MRTRNLVPTTRTTGTARISPVVTSSAPCRRCEGGHHHCHATLVLHADGTAECDSADACGVREDLHEWWIACVEISCGCTGDEQDAPLLLMAA